MHRRRHTWWSRQIADDGGKTFALLGVVGWKGKLVIARHRMKRCAGQEHPCNGQLTPVERASWGAGHRNQHRYRAPRRASSL